MVPETVTGTATAMANLLMVMAIHATRRARRPTGATTPQARAVPVASLAHRTVVRVASVVWTATILTTTSIRAASGGRQRLRRRCLTCKVAGGLVGGHRRRRMPSALGAPMHFARSAKPPCVMPGLRSLPPCIPLKLLFNLFRLTRYLFFLFISIQNVLRYRTSKYRSP
jgi:hypothetical protein